MNDYTKDTMNAWFYVEGAFWDEDWDGEPVVTNHPISFTDMAHYLQGETEKLSQEGELFFSMTGGIFYNEFQTRYMFNESTLYEAELRTLYQNYRSSSDHSDVTDTLNKPSILLSLYTPCSETQGSRVSFPLPLPSFFQMMQDHYEHPEEQILIEDIPF